MYNSSFLSIVFIAGIFLSCSSLMHNQDLESNSLTFRSYLKANQILDKAIIAHGGIDRLRAIRNISLEFRGSRHMINQSRTPEAPWDLQPVFGHVVADLEHRQLYNYSSNTYPGIGAFAGSYVVRGNEGFHYEPEKNYMGDEIIKLTEEATHSPWNYSKRWLVPLLLVQLYENKNDLRFLGTINKHQSVLQVVNFVQPKGYTMSLYFDAKNHYFRGYEALRDDGVYGDSSDEGIFDQYTGLAGITVPLKRIDYFKNEIARELTLKVTIDTELDTSLFSYPSGYREASQETEYTRIHQIAPGVFIDKEMGGILFMEFKDFVSVLDCPGNFFMSYSTIEEIRKKIPGKTIKYIIPSHTHGDHGGGARAYYYIGATLITTPGHESFYKKLATIQQTLSPDSLSLFPRVPVIETFTDKKIITDGELSLELYNAGPTAHSNEITFAYLPEQKIIWQADLFFVPGTGEAVNQAMPITIEFAKKLKTLKMDDFKFIIDGHNSRLITREQFSESLRRGGYQF